MATLKEIFEGNTADILEATELLKVLGDREGQFVWKQLTEEGGEFVAFVTADDENSYPDEGEQDGYWYEIVKEGSVGLYLWKVYNYESWSTSDVTITQIGTGDRLSTPPPCLQFSSNVVDFTTLSAEDLIGMKITSNWSYSPLTIISATEMQYGSNLNNKIAYTWNASERKLTSDMFSFYGSTYTWALSAPTNFEKKSLVGYTASENATDYPNGGMQDGYWYELVGGSVGGIEYSIITLSTPSLSLTIPHGLKVKPQYSILLPLDSTATGNSATSMEVVTEVSGRTGYCVYQSGGTTTVSKATPNSSGKFTETSVYNNAAGSGITFKGTYMSIIVA